MKKILVTLNINNYQPAIRALTYPLMKAYAAKIGAEFVEITERKFAGFPTVYEKLQVAEVAKAKGAEWALFFDADALINPEMFDPTAHLEKHTVCFNGKDMSGIRFKPDQYSLRDGRWIGACNWFCCSSDWCYEDLYRPLDITMAEAVSSINVTVQEHNSGMFGDNHLIDDFTLSRNIARHSLRHDTLLDICGRMGMRDQHGRPANPFLYHVYSMTEEEKLNRMLALLSTPQNQPAEVGGTRPMGGWQLMTAEDVLAFRARLFKDERGQWDLKP